VTFIHYGPNWLADRFGNANPCKSVLEVALMGTNIADRDLSVVKCFKQARMVLLNGTDVKGPGLNELAHLSRLEELDLTKSAITDEGLTHLRGIQKIKRLSLARTKVSDQGVIQLQQMNHLQELDLEDTKVTDMSFQYLIHLPLKWLNVRRTLITTNGIESFQKQNPTVHVTR